ncbi:FlgO family outer membrane protein [Catenovulum adriaticum]|uniref:FlgO family outer membrane protein n=1 Tax=Catenovulum adriaticum TaxID=2984846 RepID=A0ABY7AL96_9ALTE|nr:FlgO family outer membrane protein [Catenovulum sp. TS8]WAJ69436.1 FlgO family outer membrane protein [Catenovulum sp. TS8]
MPKIAKFASVFSLFMLGCSTQTVNSYLVPDTPEAVKVPADTSNMSQLSVKAYSFMLADELLQPLAQHNLNGNMLVTRFVDQQSRTHVTDKSSPLADLGGQLEESFIYELQKRGYKVIDFKLRDSVLVQPEGDYIWSRDLADLKSKVDAKYVVSGTLTPHQNGAVVNIRMMNMKDGVVLATAQGFVPNNVFWSDEKVTTRNGILMHKGENNRVIGGDRESYF